MGVNHDVSDVTNLVSEPRFVNLDARNESTRVLRNGTETSLLFIDWL